MPDRDGNVKGIGAIPELPWKRDPLDLFIYKVETMMRGEFELEMRELRRRIRQGDVTEKDGEIGVLVKVHP